MIAQLASTGFLFDRERPLWVGTGHPQCEGEGSRLIRRDLYLRVFRHPGFHPGWRASLTQKSQHISARLFASKMKAEG